MNWVEATGINWVEAIGYLGTALTIAATAMSTMIPLRIIALCASCAMITYGFLTGSWPIVLMEAVQIPINAVRLYQMVRLVRDVEKAAEGDLSLDWLKPYGETRSFKAGQTIFRKGERATELFTIESGRFCIPEHDLEIGPGAVVGELGMLAPDNLRTGSLVCIEAGRALSVSYSDVKQLYYQNPEFGFYFLRLTSERLFQSAGHAPKAKPANADDRVPALPEAVPAAA